jgi:hypothetical protein
MSRRVAATSGGSGVRHAVHSIDWGERLVVEPRTFAALFTNNALVVPLFQRAYCWDERNVRQWWCDAVSERGDDIHSCGPCVFYRSTTHSRDDSAQPVLVCIDGQQRCTTMQLLIICLRDAALSVDASALATRLGRLLHRDGAAEPRACVFGVGAPPPRGFAPTLLPSFVDRAPFFTLLAQQAGPKPSMMATAKRVMDDEIASARGRLGADAFVEWLEAAATRSLARMALMYIEVRSTSIDPGQIFLWLQEKALWSDGAALSSSSPAAAGRTFRAADLVRNFVLAASANLPLREQEATLREQWIDPIERVVFERAVEAGGRAAAAPDGARLLDAVIDEFLVARERARLASFAVSSATSGDAAASSSTSNRDSAEQMTVTWRGPRLLPQSRRTFEAVDRFDGSRIEGDALCRLGGARSARSQPRRKIAPRRVCRFERELCTVVRESELFAARGRDSMEAMMLYARFVSAAEAVELASRAVAVAAKEGDEACAAQHDNLAAKEDGGEICVSAATCAALLVDLRAFVAGSEERRRRAAGAAAVAVAMASAKRSSSSKREFVFVETGGVGMPPWEASELASEEDDDEDESSSST